MGITQGYLEQLELSQLTELAKFVVEENFNHHCENSIPEMQLQKDVQEIYNQELVYFKNSKIFVVKDASRNIQGSIRVIKWDYKTELPIQKVFNINPLDVIQNDPNISSIWHIGRFATNKTNKEHPVQKIDDACYCTYLQR